MEQETATGQVAIITKSIEVFKTAPEVLKVNQERTAKALIVGNDILSKWEGAWRIEDEEARISALRAIDERSNTYMANCSTALKQEKEVRSAITQLMDSFKKMFTSAENLIDATGPDTVPSKVQKQRNALAVELKKISDQKIKEAADKANKEKERASLVAEIEKYVFNAYSDVLRAKKDSILKAFNSCTLEYAETLEKNLKDFLGLLPDASFDGLMFIGRSGYHSKAETDVFLATAIQASLPGFKSNYEAETILLRDDLLDKLPSKINELLEAKRLADEQEELRIAAENDAAAQKLLDDNIAAQKKLEDDRIERERLDKLEMDRQEAAAKEVEMNKIDVKEQGDATMAMFSREAEVADTPAPAAKLGYTIAILHPVAYTQIMALWFENVGKNLPVDKIGNTKLDQMKAWCEKKAFDEGLKIEGKFLRYDDLVKAKTIKAKTAAI